MHSVRVNGNGFHRIVSHPTSGTARSVTSPQWTQRWQSLTGVVPDAPHEIRPQTGDGVAAQFLGEFGFQPAQHLAGYQQVVMRAVGEHHEAAAATSGVRLAADVPAPFQVVDDLPGRLFGDAESLGQFTAGSAGTMKHLERHPVYRAQIRIAGGGDPAAELPEHELETHAEQECQLGPRERVGGWWVGCGGHDSMLTHPSQVALLKAASKAT